METQAPYEVAKRPDVVDVSIMKDANFLEDRLVFYTDLTDELIERLSKLMTTLHKGRQWHWAAFWRKLEESGYEWTHYVPMDSGGRPMISLSRAHTWRFVDRKFPVDTRIYANLTYSHYEAVRAIEENGAHEILDAANGNRLSVAELATVVKEMKGPKKEKEIRTILFQCKQCLAYIEVSEDDFK